MKKDFQKWCKIKEGLHKKNKRIYAHSERFGGVLWAVILVLNKMVKTIILSDQF